MLPLQSSVSTDNALRVLGTLGLLVVLKLLHLLYRLISIRLHVRRTAREFEVPLVPHNLLFGSMISIGNIASGYPRDVSSSIMPSLVALGDPELARSGAFYMDVWPVGNPLLVVFDPDMAAQFTQNVSLPKAISMKNAFRPFFHEKDLVTSDGPGWKAWRSVFNPGFSAKNITALVPAMVQEAQVFREWLQTAARHGKVVRLDDYTSKVTMDIMGQAVLGARLEAQTKPSALAKALQRVVSQLAFNWDPLMEYSPLRPFILWRNNRIIRRELTPHIERCLAEADKTDGPKTILGLAIKAYAKEIAPANASPSSAARHSSSLAVDPQFVDLLIIHLKAFLFAGTDTTATTLCWLYHLLGNNPATLAKVRAEHDAVLGPDAGAVADAVTAHPALLNQLPYTQAVIKETLRLVPPLGTVREGEKGFFLTHPETGRRIPTEGFVVHGCVHALHRDPRIWARADEFVPERWLVRDPADPLYPPKNAWKPFELGPRNCIGQELVQIELRLLLAFSIREVDIRSEYPEDGPRVFGDLAYPANSARDITAHPNAGMPVRVTLLHKT